MGKTKLEFSIFLACVWSCACYGQAKIPTTVQTSDSAFALAREPQIRRGINQARSIISSWDQLNIPSRDAAMRVVNQFAEDVDRFYERLRHGDPVPFAEYDELVDLQCLSKRLAAQWTDPQLIAEFIRRSMLMYIGPAILCADLWHPTERINVAIAKLGLDQARTAKYTQILAEYQSQIEPIVKSLPDSGSAEYTVAMERAKSQAYRLADATWEKLGSVLSETERAELTQQLLHPE